MTVPLHVLVPTASGLTVVNMENLAARLDAGESGQEAVDNAGIETVSLFGYPTLGVTTLIERVRQLNLTGDVDAYWDSQP